MPLPRFERLDPERRAALLDAAARHFAERGYDGASLNEILAEVGIGKSSYYYYFSDKEDLFTTVMEGRFADAHGQIASLSLDERSEAAWWGSVEHFLSQWMSAFDADPLTRGLSRALQTMRRSPPPRLRPLFEVTRAMYARWIERGKELGFVRTDVATPVLVGLLEAVDMALDDALLEDPALDLDLHARRVVDTYRRILVPGEIRRQS